MTEAIPIRQSHPIPSGIDYESELYSYREHLMASRLSDAQANAYIRGIKRMMSYAMSGDRVSSLK